MDVVKSNDRNIVEEETARKYRLIILERNPFVRDTCSEVLDRLNCDLYSTAYIENIDKIVGRFDPDGIVIDVGLFDGDGVGLLELVVNVEPKVQFLFLGGEDSDLAESAENLARSIGLHVEENLQRPIDKSALKRSLRRMAYSTA